MCWQYERAFPPDASAPELARSFVRDRLNSKFGTSADDAIVQDMVLIASELVANAVLASTQTLAVALHGHRRELRIVVTDSADGWPILQQPQATQTHGRGLTIVNALATGWGVRQLNRGKSVWATLSTSAELTASLTCDHP